MAAMCPNGTVNWKQIYGEETFILKPPIYESDLMAKRKAKQFDLEALEKRAREYAAKPKDGPVAAAAAGPDGGGGGGAAAAEGAGPQLPPNWAVAHDAAGKVCVCVCEGGIGGQGALVIVFSLGACYLSVSWHLATTRRRLRPSPPPTPPDNDKTALLLEQADAPDNLEPGGADEVRSTAGSCGAAGRSSSRGGCGWGGDGNGRRRCSGGGGRRGRRGLSAVVGYCNCWCCVCGRDGIQCVFWVCERCTLAEQKRQVLARRFVMRASAQQCATNATSAITSAITHCIPIHFTILLLLLQNQVHAVLRNAPTFSVRQFSRRYAARSGLRDLYCKLNSRSGLLFVQRAGGRPHRDQLCQVRALYT